MNNQRWQALKVAVVYCTFGAGWILLSDQVLLLTAGGDGLYAGGQTVKGLAFILLTGVLLYALVVRSLTALDASHEQLRALERDRNLALERSNRELERVVEERTLHLTEANDRLSAFNYAAAHDLKSPLRTIVGFTHVLREDHHEGLGPAGIATVARIEHAAGRLRELVDDLLRLSQVTVAELNPEDFDMSAMAEQLLQEVAGRNPDRPYRVSVAPGLRAYADPSLSRNILQNIFENAWKFSRTTEVVDVSLGAVREGSTLWFFVRDKGVGFDSDRAEEVFDPFVRLHAQSDFPGTGIGLATVARIVKRHGGACRAESRRGGGATIWFHFGPIPEAESVAQHLRSA